MMQQPLAVVLSSPHHISDLITSPLSIRDPAERFLFTPILHPFLKPLKNAPRNALNFTHLFTRPSISNCAYPRKSNNFKGSIPQRTISHSKAPKLMPQITISPSPRDPKNIEMRTDKGGGWVLLADFPRKQQHFRCSIYLLHRISVFHNMWRRLQGFGCRINNDADSVTLGGCSGWSLKTDFIDFQIVHCVQSGFAVWIVHI